MQYACPSLVALVKENGPEVLPARIANAEMARVVLSWRRLLMPGGGVPKDPAAAVTLFRQSCDDGWWRGCGGLGRMLPRRSRYRRRPGAGVRVFREGLPRRRGGQLLLRRQHVPRDERRSDAPISASSRPAISASGTRSPTRPISGPATTHHPAPPPHSARKRHRNRPDKVFT